MQIKTHGEMLFVTNVEARSNSFNGWVNSRGLANLRNLEFLDLSENGMTGSLQELGICNLKNLIEFDLSENNFEGGNHLEGLIPEELCQLKYLSILDLSRNRFSGTIPSCFTNVINWVEQSNATYRIPLDFGYSIAMDNGYSIASDNFTLEYKRADSFVKSTEETVIGFVSKNRYESYKGSILHYMLGINLSSNELTGDIPTDIGNLQQIIAMNLSRNFLSGTIPESFSNLTNIQSLDLSYNKLSGRIPPQLTQLNSLAIFNVSFNNLSGQVPDKGQFGSFVENSYGGNPDLCGPQIKRNCGSSEPTTPSGAEEDQEDESTIHMVSFYWSLFASYVTTIMGFVLILWLNSDWRKQWFCFIDACIISCYCWILRNVFHRYDDIYVR
ncbi:hypothetical protein QYF36_003986 [Acer negundo]|nr:hypothetical protein QYF36_003986 [Acer negundo]